MGLSRIYLFDGEHHSSCSATVTVCVNALRFSQRGSGTVVSKNSARSVYSRRSSYTSLSDTERVIASFADFID